MIGASLACAKGVGIWRTLDVAAPALPGITARKRYCRITERAVIDSKRPSGTGTSTPPGTPSRPENRSTAASEHTPAPADELASSIQASVTEIAVMWILHWSQTRRAPAESLEQRITNFSSRAFDAITARFAILRRAREDHLWMIYFKGLLTAGTHPRNEMIRAIKAVSARNWNRKSAPLSVVPDASSGSESATTASQGDDADSDVLEQIGKALKMDRE